MRLPKSVRERVALASSEGTSADELLMLATDPSRAVRLAVCDNGSATAEIIAATLQYELEHIRPNHSRDVINRVINHRTFDEPMMLQFVDRKVFTWQYALATSKRATPNVLSKLACHAPNELMEDILSNPSAPAELLIAQAGTGSEGIIRAIVSNRAAPASAISIIGGNPVWRDDPAIGALLLCHPNCTEDVLLLLAKEDRPHVLIFSNFVSPSPAALDAISASSHFHVRRQVAAHPNTSKETLRRMCSDKTRSVRETARQRLGEC